MAHNHKNTIMAASAGAAVSLLAAAVVLAANSAATTTESAETRGGIGGTNQVESNNASARSIDSRLQAMENLQDRINDMNINNTRKTAIEKRIQAAIELLNNAKQEKSGSEGTDQAAAGKGAAGDKAGRAQTRLNLGLAVPQGFMLGALQRIETISQNLKKISNKLQTAIDKKSAAGADSADAKSQLQKMNDLLVSAKEKASQANDIIADIDPDAPTTTKDEVLRQMKLARQLVAEATLDLKEARQAAMDALRSLKENAKEHNNENN